MTVKDIVMLVFDFVGEKEIFEKLSASSELSTLEQEKVNSAVRCFNLVNQEIASDYLPYLTKEEVGDVCLLPFSDLSETLVNIYEAKNKYGKTLKFKIFSSFVQFSGKARTVTYSFLPSELEIDDEVNSCAGLSTRIFAYGVASEYLFVSGLSADAETFESRFKDSLFVLSRKRGEHVLPKRSWW